MKADRETLARSGRFLALGLQIAGSIVGGLVLGHWADRYLGTEPWLTMGFTLGALYGAIRLLLWALKRPNDRRIP